VVNLRIGSPRKKELITLIVIAIVTALLVSPKFVKAQYSSEYQRFVHNYLNSEALGNWTCVEKPVFPVVFNDSQILVGQNWSIVCPLFSNRRYHVYCYGGWVDYGPEPKTDYDIYVYNPLGEMEGYHTESAGLPEHLGTTVEEPFFVPEYTGNYTFVIVNDARESKGAQEATFMIIEDVECNVWDGHYVEGKDNRSQPVLNTSWAYEFVTESQLVEVYIKVPKTLDVYETRLYLMSDSQSENRTISNGVPLPWEPGLFGNRSNGNNVIGGYNLESKEYRGVAYASCEFYGKDMFLNYTSSSVGKSLYHVVFIGETGFGAIDFLIKTEFNNTCLKPLNIPGRVYPSNDVTIAYMSNSSDLKNAVLEYSIDSWRSVNVTDMEIFENRTCRAAISEQAAGTFVNYEVKANDTLENVLTANGSYSVKYPSTLNFSSAHAEARLGENITIRGFLTPQAEGTPITLYISSANESKAIVCYTLEDGTFMAGFKPETVGTWIAYARCNGSSSVYESESSSLIVQVDEPLFAKYSFYIFGGMGAVAAIGIVIYVRKSKG
jgi:hypothetical protein